VHLADAVSVAFALSGDRRIALGIGLVEPMVQTVAYMLHEKAWSIRPSVMATWTPTHARASGSAALRSSVFVMAWHGRASARYCSPPGPPLTATIAARRMRSPIRQPLW